MTPHPDPLPALMYQYCFNSAGRGNGRGAKPLLMSFALQHENMTVALLDNASVQFPLKIYTTKGSINPSSDRFDSEAGGDFYHSRGQMQPVNFGPGWKGRVLIPPP